MNGNDDQNRRNSENERIANSEPTPPDPEEITEALTEIAAGLDPIEVLVKNKYPRVLLEAWLQRGRSTLRGRKRPPADPYEKFAHAVDVAQARARVREEANLLGEARNDPRAAATLLKLRRQREYERRLVDGRDNPRAWRPNPIQARENEQVCWDLRCEGYTPEAIAEMTGLHRSSVEGILKRVEKQARDRLVGITERVQVTHIFRHERLAEEAYREWVASKQVGLGDPRYLKLVSENLAAIRGIVGADAPIRITASTDASVQHQFAAEVLRTIHAARELEAHVAEENGEARAVGPLADDDDQDLDQEQEVNDDDGEGTSEGEE